MNSRPAAIVLSMLLATNVGATPLPGVIEQGKLAKPLEKHFSLAGYLRLRFDVFDNLDLDHGPTPSSGLPLFPVPPSDLGRGPITSANMRLRLDPSVRLGLGVSLHARVDVLDNVVLGSTPNGLPATPWAPMASASTRAVPPEAGRNADSDSIRVKRAWGQVALPFGVLSAGRMGSLIDWGTGFFLNAGNTLDGDLGDQGDRIAFSAPLWGHLVTIAFDFSSVGPTSSRYDLYPQPFNLDRRDDIRSWALVIAKYDTPQVVERYLRAGRMVWQYGAVASVRSQDLDLPVYYLTGDRQRSHGREDLVQRDLLAFVGDLWIGLRVGDFAFDIEAALLVSSLENGSLLPGIELRQPLSATQFGGIARARYSRPRFEVAFELGMASGDQAPGFGVRSPLGQLESQPGDLDGPQIRLPGDTTLDNFRFNPEYRIDLILWRRIIGTITDAIYARPSVAYRPTKRLSLWGAAIFSNALNEQSTPGEGTPLGVEFNVGAIYSMDPGFELALSYGLLLPLAGLDNTRLGLDAAVAQTLHAIIAYRL